MGNVRDKVIVLAGAGGISTATARLLGDGGAKVVVGDIRRENAEHTASIVGQAGGEARALVCDISDESQVKSLIDHAVDQFGGIDGLFNVAADIRPENIGQDGDALEIPLAIWQHTIDVNLTGYLYTIRHVIPHLLERGGGSIVNTMSAAAYLGEPMRLAYAVTKAAGGALTRHVANRWGKQGIRCNAIAPGMVLTEGATANMPQKALDHILATLPHTRHGQPEDIAEMVVLLLSDEGVWINGQSISVDGGALMRA